MYFIHLNVPVIIPWCSLTLFWCNSRSLLGTVAQSNSWTCLLIHYTPNKTNVWYYLHLLAITFCKCMMMKVLSHPGHDKSRWCILGNWTCFPPEELNKPLGGELKRLQEAETSPVAYSTAPTFSGFFSGLTIWWDWVHLSQLTHWPAASDVGICMDGDFDFWLLFRFYIGYNNSPKKQG